MAVGPSQPLEDESGDAHAFTVALAQLAAAKEVAFVSVSTSSSSIAHATRSPASSPTAAITHPMRWSWRWEATRHFLPATSASIADFTRKGYSIRVAIEELAAAPTVSVTDETRFTAFSRLGNTLRVAGTAELAGWNTSLDPARVEPLKRNAQDPISGRVGLHAVNPWCGCAYDTGLRPRSGRHPLRKPISQHRSRDTGLDHGLRLDTDYRRHDF